MSDTWVQELTTDMIPDGICKTIAEKIGTENLLEVLTLIGGSTFYFPKAETMLRSLRDQKIRKEFNGFNSFELSMKYNISERWVQLIIEKADTDKTSRNRGNTNKK